MANKKIKTVWYDGLKGKNTLWLFIFGIVLFVYDFGWWLKIGYHERLYCEGVAIGGWAGGYYVQISPISRILLTLTCFVVLFLSLSLIKRQTRPYKVKVSKILFLLFLLSIAVLVTNIAAIFC